MERLDKVLASTGRWSRREAKELIREGRVLVDGQPAGSGEQKVDPAGDLSGFADRSSVADWARDGLSWAVGEGLIAGRSSDALDPQGLTTRAELAQIVMRFVEG